MKEAGYNDPHAAASYEGLSLEEFALKVFPDMYNNVDSPCLEKVESLGNGEEGETSIQSAVYKNRSVFSLNGPVKIARIAFSSYLRLASALGHELVHVQNVQNGNMSVWYNKYKSEDYRKAMSEFESISWEIINQGLPNYNLFKSYGAIIDSFNN